MYTSENFRTKKALREAVASGKKVRVWQPNADLFGGAADPPLNGTVYLEGPQNAPHSWYAQAVLKDGVIVKVKNPGPEQTVRGWLIELAGKDSSSDADSTKMQNLLHRIGYPAAVVVLGIVYLEGRGTMKSPPQSIHSLAKQLLMADKQSNPYDEQEATARFEDSVGGSARGFVLKRLYESTLQDWRPLMNYPGMRGKPKPLDQVFRAKALRRGFTNAQITAFLGLQRNPGAAFHTNYAEAYAMTGDKRLALEHRTMAATSRLNGIPNPARFEKGNWPAYNVKYIVGNVEKVLKTGNIDHLSQVAYKFITLHMGFIAHYDLGGFKSTYSNVAEFAQTLLTSEYSEDTNYNDHWADKIERGYFGNEYGKAHDQSMVDTIRGITAAVKRRKLMPGAIRATGSRRPGLNNPLPDKMTVELNLHGVTKVKRNGGPKIYSESTFWYHVRNALRKQGYDVIESNAEREAANDKSPVGLWGDKYTHVVTMRNRSWVLFHNSYAIYNVYEPYNQRGEVDLSIATTKGDIHYGD